MELQGKPVELKLTLTDRPFTIEIKSRAVIARNFFNNSGAAQPG